MTVVHDVREVLSHRELLANLTMRELRGKYKGTVLGWAWSLVNPLASTLVFTVVFSAILKITPPVGAGGLQNYAMFLLCGLLAWNFLSGCITTGMGALVGNGNLIKKTYFPRQLLVVSSVAAGGVTFGIEMLVLVVALSLFGVPPLVYVPLVVLFMVLLALFGLGIGLMLSVLNVYFRDVAHFVGIFMQIWFYATPIIYPPSLVADAAAGDGWVARFRIADVYEVNPMVGFVEVFRDLLYVQQLPSPATVAYLVVVTAAVLVLGAVVFSRKQGRLAEEL
jgi:ABC-2 type transport system permease protein